MSTLSNLPPKVRAVIQRRLSMLSPAAQALAQTAAVIGREFTFDVLIRAGDQDEASVVQSLDELWRRQLVREQGVDAYDFSHDKIRAVAYAGISPIRRRSAHLSVATAIEALNADDLDPVSGQVATHYELAGRPQPGYCVLSPGRDGCSAHLRQRRSRPAVQAPARRRDQKAIIPGRNL